MFEWKNLPDTVDARFLELALFNNGYALYFNDETIGDLCLECMVAGRLNVYRIPIFRRAYSVNGYQAERTEKDSVIILMHDSSDKILTYEMLSDLIAYLREQGYIFENIYDLLD